jgi:hypothetical protein
MPMRRDQVFYAVLCLVACLLWASLSSARAYDHRLILTDHLRKERWVGTPEQSIKLRCSGHEVDGDVVHRAC